MKKATISVPDEIEVGLDSYLADQEIAPSLTRIVQAALREFLVNRGYLEPPPKLRITSAPQGSGASDVSVNHDHYLATPD